MIKEMKGWKVLSNGRLSARACTTVHYPIGKEIRPNIKGSKLFFFKKYEDADRFFLLKGERIVSCVARNVTKPKYMIDNIFGVHTFWQWKNEHPNRSIKEYRPTYPTYFPIVTTVPKGTYWAESITCLE